MPCGIIIDCACLALGGLLGSIGGIYFPQRIRDYLSKFFGITSIAVGVNLIGQTQSLSPVMLALILGAIIGEGLKLDEHLEQLSIRISHGKEDKDFIQRYISVMVLMCSGSLGLMGAMTEGLTGDASLILTKGILDFAGGAIFAANLGASVVLIAIPQLALYLLLFFCAGFIMPCTNAYMLADFSACGGVIALVTGLRIAEIKRMRVTCLLPSLILVMPISALWHAVLG